MDKQDIIERIKKCLRLAKSANANEAGIAMHQAQKLMELHGLTAEEIAIADINESAIKAKSKNLPTWHLALIKVVAESFGCAWLIHPHYKHSEVKFVGLPMRTQIATYAYTVGIRHILGARRVFIAGLRKNCKPSTKTLRADDYCEGFVCALIEKMEALAIDDEGQALISRYIEKHYPTLVSTKPLRTDARAQKQRAKQPDYSHKGYKDGSKVSLHRGMAGGKYEPKKLEV